MGQALALAAIAYLIHLCGKFWPIGRRKGVVLQCGQQGIYPFAPQCAAKQAGKHPALRHKPGRRAGRQGARFQVCLHHFIALHGQCPVSYTHLDVYKRQKLRYPPTVLLLHLPWFSQNQRSHHRPTV